MKISKFFRRYSRILLMVFMSLLLVVFLVGDVLQNIGSNMANPKIKLGRAFDQDIYTTNLQEAASKQALLVQMGIMTGWERGLLDDPLDMYLVMEEARRMGVRIGHDQVKQVLRGLPNAEGVLARLQQRTGRSYDSMYDVAAEWLAARTVAALQIDVLGDSLPRAELAYRNSRQQAQVQLSVLDSHAFVPSVPEPGEEELLAFFEQTKARDEGHTEDSLEFGHALPDRVRLEYITVDPREIAARVSVRRPEVKAYFEDHPQKYMKTIIQPPETPSTQPAQPRTTRVPMTYEEAKDRAREDCRLEKAVREAQGLIYDLRHEAYRSWQASTLENGFRTPPPADAIVPFEELAERFSKQYEVTYELTGLLDQDGIRKLFDNQPDFIRQQRPLEPLYREGQMLVWLSELALRVQGILTPPAEDDTRPVLSLLEPSPVLMRYEIDSRRQQSRAYQAFVFCVVEIKPKGPPNTLDDVRAKVVADYKLMKAHELAGQRARELGEQARQVGLSAALEQDTELKELLQQAREAWQPPPESEDDFMPPQRPQYVTDLGPNERALTRDDPALAGVGETRKVQREVFALAERPEGPTPGRDVVVVEVAGAFRWVIAELEEIKPLYAGEFDAKRIAQLRENLSWERQELVLAWFEPLNVRKRAGFAPEHLPEQPEQPEE